ncbi:MAG: hypothetical protein ACLQPH_14865 [Acidimicrobiales bacterium]
MSLRHTLASLCFAGSLACGGLAIANVITSDVMSQAVMVSSGNAPHRTPPIDEHSPSRQPDDNSDDVTAISLAGLAVEVEIPKAISEPTGPAGDAPTVIL